MPLLAYYRSRRAHWAHSITEYCHTHSIDVAECVQQMRDRVREEMKLTVSAGIAPNMVRMIFQV